jgi:hypothetical protein
MVSLLLKSLAAIMMSNTDAITANRTIASRCDAGLNNFAINSKGFDGSSKVEIVQHLPST